MIHLGRVSDRVSESQSVATFDQRGVAHACFCGGVPVAVVRVTEPLVFVLGPLPVCAGCLPGFELAVAFLHPELRSLVVELRAWSE